MYLDDFSSEPRASPSCCKANNNEASDPLAHTKHLFEKIRNEDHNCAQRFSPALAGPFPTNFQHSLFCTLTYYLFSFDASDFDFI